MKLGGLLLSYFDSSTNRNISDFPYDIDPGLVQQAFNRISGLKNVRVTR